MPSHFHQNFLITKTLDSVTNKRVQEIFYQGFYMHYGNINPNIPDDKKYLTTPDIYFKYGDEKLINDIKTYLKITDINQLLNSTPEQLVEYAKIINTKSAEDEDFKTKKNLAISNFLNTHKSYFDNFLSPDNQENIAIMFDENDMDKIIGFATFKIFDNSLLDDLGNKKIPNAKDTIAYVAQASVDPKIIHERCAYKIANAIAGYLQREGVEEMTFITRIFNQKAFALVAELNNYSINKNGESIFTEATAKPSLFGYVDGPYKALGVVNVAKFKQIVEGYFHDRQRRESPSASLSLATNGLSSAIGRQ